MNKLDLLKMRNVCSVAEDEKTGDRVGENPCKTTQATND